MTEQNSVSENTDNDGWPRVIALPRAKRPWREPVEEPARVAKAEDLPDRMYMGRCDRESFRKTGKGWSVCYRASVEGTGSEVEYDAERGSLVIKLSYRGELGLVGMSKPKVFADSLRGMLWSLPEKWPGIFEREVGSIVNVQLPRIPDTGDRLCSYPDGGPYSIYCPVAVDRLVDTLSCVDRMTRDPSIVAPIINADLWLGGSEASYFERRNAAPMNDPLTADEAALRHFGLPVGQPSTWEYLPSGVRALSVHRRHYSLIVDVYFHDLEPVLGALHAAGVIDGAAENAAVVVPFLLSNSTCRGVLEDSRKTRWFAPWFPRDVAAIKELDSRPYEAAGTVDRIARALGLSSKARKEVRG